MQQPGHRAAVYQLLGRRLRTQQFLTAAQTVNQPSNAARKDWDCPNTQEDHIRLSLIDGNSSRDRIWRWDIMPAATANGQPTNNHASTTSAFRSSFSNPL